MGICYTAVDEKCTWQTLSFHNLNKLFSNQKHLLPPQNSTDTQVLLFIFRNLRLWHLVLSLHGK